MARYIKGIDVALWEPNIDWMKVRAQDIRYVFIKASQGDFTDPLFDSHWTGAKRAGILRGAYHFLDPRMDGTLQAETYLRKVKMEPGDLPPVLDLEELKSSAPQKPKGTKGKKGSKEEKGKKGGRSMAASGLAPNSQIVANAEKWLTKVEAETGRKPIIYSGPFFLKDRVSGSGGKPPKWAKDYMLWIANYLNHEVQDNDLPLQPVGWADWTFWQYSETGLLDGIMNKEGTKMTGVDLNFFRGTLKELYELAGADLPDDIVGVEVPGSEVLKDAAEEVVVLPTDMLTGSVSATLKHLVRPGDTLSALAVKFNTTIEAIMALNPQITNPNLIRDGDTLDIPQG
jgi:lysozyme